MFNYILPDNSEIPLEKVNLQGNLSGKTLNFDRKNLKVGSLNLNNTSLKKSDLPMLLSFLKEPQFEYLRVLLLFNNAIGCEGALALCPFLKDNKTLRHLDLSACQIQSSGIKALSVIKTSLIQELNLTHNRFSDEGASLGEILEDNRSLQILALNSCNIGSIGIKSLAKAIARNNTLSKLFLDGNTNIDDEGTKSLMTALKVNSSLRTLNICAKKIGTETIETLCEYLLNQRILLTYLRLSKLEKVTKKTSGLIEKIVERSLMIPTSSMLYNPRILRIDGFFPPSDPTLSQDLAEKLYYIDDFDFEDSCNSLLKQGWDKKLKTLKWLYLDDLNLSQVNIFFDLITKNIKDYYLQPELNLEEISLTRVMFEGKEKGQVFKALKSFKKVKKLSFVSCNLSL